MYGLFHEWIHFKFVSKVIQKCFCDSKFNQWIKWQHLTSRCQRKWHYGALKVKTPVDGKDTTLTGSCKIPPRMCVFLTRCHRKGNKFLHPSATFYFHTFCASVSAPHTHDSRTREATTAETFEVTQLRWLKTPHCQRTNCVLSVHNLQRADVKWSLCQVLPALTEVRLGAPCRPRASEKIVFLFCRNTFFALK